MNDRKHSKHDFAAFIAVLLFFAITAASVFAQDETSAPADGTAPDTNITLDLPPEVTVPPEVESEAPTADNKKEANEDFTRYDALLASLTIFVLAIFIGFEVITKVPPTLHTPLMSGSNAISGITIVGAILATGFSENWFVSLVGMIALILATVNVVGGFLVTHRMLEMFKKKK